MTSEITFYGKPDAPPLPSDALFIDLRMPNFTVPSGITNYVCMSFSLPIDKEYSIIQIDPLVTAENVARVHHFIGNICENVTDGYVTKYSTPGSCLLSLGDLDSGCDGILNAWAAGGGSTVLPSEVGFAMGPGPTSTKFIVLEVHYNNPDGLGGYVDTSGIRIWYTDRVRKYEAAMIALGDPGVTLPSIPALAVTEIENECPSACTQKKLEQEIHIWQSFPHMHQLGSQMWTTQWRGNELVAEIGRIEYWAFDHQQIQFVNFTIRPGDRLNTHCVFDTRSKNTTTKFGFTSSDEMCIHFLGYYPRAPQGTLSCGYGAPNYTACVDEFLHYHSPTVLDPKGGANRTFGVSNTELCQKPENDHSHASRLYWHAFAILCAIAIILQ
jgi:dopamine beta-monooxygenase